MAGMLVGGVTPFALPPALPVYVDEAVREQDFLILGGGGRSCKIKLAPAELRRLAGLQVVAGLARPRSTQPSDPAGTPGRRW